MKTTSLPICDICGPVHDPVIEYPALSLAFLCPGCYHNKLDVEQDLDDLERDKLTKASLEARRDGLEQARVMGLARVECEEVYLEQFNTVLEWIFKH